MRRFHGTGSTLSSVKWRTGCARRASRRELMSRRWLVLALVVIAILLLSGRVLSAWYVDYQWFAVQGATRLWWVRTADLALLRGVVFAAVAAFAFANLFAV